MSLGAHDSCESASTTPMCAGVDIGGTKIAVGAVDAAGGVRQRVVRPTPRGAGRILDTVAELVTQLGKPEATGVGAPGVIDAATGRVLSATDTIPGWAGTDVAGELCARIGSPVAVDNDVRAMAYGETALGAARGYANALFVSVGTGLGGAIRRHGELLHGSHGTAGEIAHMYVGRVGRQPCGCGRHGHLEAAVAGPAIALAYGDRTGDRLRSLEQVAELMRDGNPEARAVIADAAELLGRALAGLVVALDVEAVIVAGGVTEIGEEWLEPLREALHREALPAYRRIPVLAADLGPDAAVVGAALLAFQSLREQSVLPL